MTPSSDASPLNSPKEKKAVMKFAAKLIIAATGKLISNFFHNPDEVKNEAINMKILVEVK